MDAKNALDGPPPLASTRGRILVLLCWRPRTVAELAAELHVTDNAIRAQIQRLQRDRFVRQAGSRRGVSKPHADYELTPKARHLFPVGYEAVLQSLVGVLSSNLSRREVRNLFRQLGRTLFREHVGKISRGDPRQRLDQIMKRLSASVIGFQVRKNTEKIVIESCSCPLASVAIAHPEFCGLVATMLSDALGTKAHETCRRGEFPKCRFEIAPAH
jgi:predicted ArsR family transcriptional regulator